MCAEAKDSTKGTGHEERVSLKEHFETRLNALQELILTRLEAIDKAVQVAHGVLQERLEGMNLFRDQLREQATTFATRAETDLRHDAIEKDLRELRLYKAKIEGMASQRSVNFTMIIAVVGAIAGVVGLMLRMTGK